jgi:hypothetical protein
LAEPMLRLAGFFNDAAGGGHRMAPGISKLFIDAERYPG